MREQAVTAMELADVIVFMVDGKEGLTSADHDVADILRRTGKEIILVVNKVDNPTKYGDNIYDFYELGLGEPIAISSVNMLNIGDLLDAIVAGFPDEIYGYEESTKIAIIGKPNVGKSSLTNKLLGENRVIVSDIAGTTRDAIDTEVTYNGTPYIFIDTAGLRRKGKVTEDIEYYSVVRAMKSLEHADIVFPLFVGEEGDK